VHTKTFLATNTAPQRDVVYVNEVAADDVDASVKRLATLAARAGVPFARRDTRDHEPAITSLLHAATLEERRAEAAKLDAALAVALDGSHLDEAADLLLDRARLARKVELNT